MQSDHEHFTRNPDAVVTVQGNILTPTIRRLEAATSRLEDIASSSVAFDSSAPGAGAAVSAPGSTAGGAASETPSAKPAEALPPSIQAYDDLLNNELKKWLELSSKLGDVIDGQVHLELYGSASGSLTCG